MPKYFSQSLPYRRLQKFANGIWDEERKTFYPFKIANCPVAAKKNISYYVNSAWTAFAVNGIQAAEISALLAMTVRGSLVYVAGVRSPILSQATDFWSGHICNPSVGLLGDPNTMLSVSNGDKYGFIYAEIPSDPAGGPVVVE